MGSDEITIRDMTIEDHEKVISFWEISGLHYRPTGRDARPRMERELISSTSFFLLAEREEEIVGTILATQDGRKGWLNRLAVRPDLRRMGIASLLIREAECRLDEMGIGMICALIENWNQSSRELFEREGYGLQENVLYYSKKEHSEF